MILDATAGNRTMWTHKTSQHIIYIDMETELERQPTIFCDNTVTPFKSKTFDTIFYDPPHTWAKIGHYHTYPRRTKEYTEKWKDTAIPRYYGWDKYANGMALTRHLYRANTEFRRIIKDDGLLWLKWNEMSLPLYKILSYFNTWQLMMKLFVASPSQTAGKHQTYWLCMSKICRNWTQSTL